jgi:beta-glucosidase
MVGAADARVDDLLGRMTIEEKVAQLGGVWITGLVHDDAFDEERAHQLLEHGIGQVTRIGASTGLRPSESAALLNQIQSFVRDHTRLGIPVLLHEESTGGYCARDATVFPQAIGLAATWDPALVEELAAVIREQMLAVGARQSLAPVLDVARDPRWGRVEETYGESPVLAGILGTAYVRGLQSDDLRHGVLATGKHFLGYGLPEGGMNHAPVQLGPRELREVYAEPFAAAIRDAGLGSIMNSYSSVDGLPCAGAPALLTELLRDELGFDGMVVADYFAVDLLRTHHHVAADKAGAAALALEAGLDVELPATDCFGAPLRDAIERGRVGEDTVDRAVRRVLSTKVALGLFDEPLVDATSAAVAFDTPVQRSIARRAAAESVVLLANDRVLPLPADLGRLAVIGPGADDRRLLQGDYHYPAHVEIVYERADEALLPQAGAAFAAGPFFTEHITPYRALVEALPSCEIVLAPGCDVSGDDRGGFTEAEAAARGADVAVVVTAGRSGLQPACTVGEARDATDLSLTGVQPELVELVAATGTPTVLVVMSGRVHTLGELADRCAAVVWVAPPGEEGGRGLADVLVGAADPSGRLPVTLPRAVGQVPTHHDHRAGGGKTLFYDNYTDSPASPAYPFGHGLSYTTFAYGDPEVDAGTTTDPIELTVEVTNTGDRAGVEVVQLYGRDDVASVARPARQLLGFARLSLEPGRRRTVRFTVDPSRLAFFDPSMRFVVEPGTFTFWVGSSSVDTRAAVVVELTGDLVEHAQRSVVATGVEIS